MGSALRRAGLYCVCGKYFLISAIITVMGLIFDFLFDIITKGVFL